MADYFQSSPNFTNPSYATPEQLAQQRAYATELTKRSGQEVNRPTGALANMINALNGNLVRNSANDIQNQAAGQNAGDVSALISQLQKGQPIDPNVAGRVYANPMAAPEHRALIGALLTPKVGEDVAGRPTATSIAGGQQALPVSPGIQPGIRPSMSVSDASISAVPQPAPPLPGAPQSMVPPTPPGVTRLDPTATNAWRQSNPLPPGIAPAGPQAGAVPPAAPPAAVPSGPMTIDQLAAKGRDLAAQRSFTQGTAEAQTGIAKEDIAAASNAPAVKQIAGTMLDDMAKHKLTFGPTAEWSNNAKRLAANYAPGLMKYQLEGLASADSFDKMSAQLTSMLSRGGGTDAQLFNNMKSVPGSHNSEQGAEALLKMVIQKADQQEALRAAVQAAKTPQEAEAIRTNFYKDPRNQIINPISGNPIAKDLAQVNASASSGPVAVSSPDEARKLPKGTPIRLPDGSIGRVP